MRSVKKGARSVELLEQWLQSRRRIIVQAAWVATELIGLVPECEFFPSFRIITTGG